MSAIMESRGWLLFVTGSTLMAILQVDCVVQEHDNYELYDTSRDESFRVPENVTDVPRSTVRTIRADKKVISTDSTPVLRTRIVEERSETSSSSSFSGNSGILTEPVYLKENVTGDSSIGTNSSGTDTTDRQIKVTRLPFIVNTGGKEYTSDANATSTHSSTLNNEGLVTNSSVTFTPEIADNTLFNTRESSIQYLGNKSSANDNEVSLSDSTLRPLSGSENVRDINSLTDNTYSVTNSELISEAIAFSTSSTSLRDVSQPEETTSSIMISTVPLSEYRQSASVNTPSSEIITSFSNSTIASGIGTDELTSFNEIIRSEYTVSSNYITESHVGESKNESLHGSVTTQQQAARVQCNNSSDCLKNEGCLKSYDGKSYCECNQNFVRDNISGACLEDSLNSHFQLQESTGITSAPLPDTTGFISRSITTDFTPTVNTFVTLDEMNFTVTDQVKNVEDSKLSSRDSNGQSATLNHEENLGTKVLTPSESSTSSSMSYQEEISKESGSTFQTTEDSFNTSLHNQEENIGKNYTLSNATHNKSRTTDEDINISSLFTEKSTLMPTPPNGGKIENNYTMSNSTHNKPKATDEDINISALFTEKSTLMPTPPNGGKIENNYTMSNATHSKPRTTHEDIHISSSFTGMSVSITTPPNGDANERQTSSTNVPTQGVVFDVKGKANCSSQTIQSKQFNLKSWNNLTSVEHSINVLGIQLLSTLNMVEWFQTYDYPFRTSIANVLAEENTEDRMNGAQNVIYIAPTPLTDGQRISICIMVASMNKLGHYLNASDAVKLILRERDFLNKEVHLQISSVSVGCPSEYREKYIKCKIAHVPPLAVAISIIVAMVVLVLILIVLLYVRRHKHDRRSYKPNLPHRKWRDARYCQTGHDLSTDFQCTEDELDNHRHGGVGEDGVVLTKNTVPNNEQSNILNDVESIDQEEFSVVIHDNKIGGIETDSESQFEDTKI